MAVGFQTITVAAGIGLFIGGTYYLYNKGYFDKILAGIIAPASPPDNGTTTPPTTVKSFDYYYRVKPQCRDDHITATWLQQQGVRVLNFKVFYDGKYYAQVCGMPGGRYFLVAVATGDATSAGILKSLDFVKYASTPLASDIDSSIPIPSPIPSQVPVPEPTPTPTPEPTPVIPTITINKATYVKGESILVTGTGFQPDEVVRVYVTMNGVQVDAGSDVAATTLGTVTNGLVVANHVGGGHVHLRGKTSNRHAEVAVSVLNSSAMAYSYESNVISYPVYIGY